MTDINIQDIYSSPSSTYSMGSVKAFPTNVRSIQDLRLNRKLENSENSPFKKAWNNINRYFDPFSIGEDAATSLAYAKKLGIGSKPDIPLITVFDRNHQSTTVTDINGNSKPSTTQQIPGDGHFKKAQLPQKKQRPRIIPRPDQYCAQFYQSFIERPRSPVFQSQPLPQAFRSKSRPQSSRQFSSQFHQSKSQPLDSKPKLLQQPSLPKSAPISFTKPVEKSSKEKESKIIERSLNDENENKIDPIEVVLKQQQEQSSELRELLQSVPIEFQSVPIEFQSVPIEPKEPDRIIETVVVVDGLEDEKVDQLVEPAETTEAVSGLEKASPPAAESSSNDDGQPEVGKSFIATPASVFLQAIGYNTYFFDQLDKGTAEFKARYDQQALEKREKMKAKQILNFYKSGTPDNINQASKLMFEQCNLQPEKSISGEFPPQAHGHGSEDDRPMFTKSLMKLQEEYERSGEDLASMTFPDIPGLYEEFDLDDVIYRFDGSEAASDKHEMMTKKQQEQQQEQMQSNGSGENLIPTFVNSSPPQINEALDEEMDFELEILKSAKMSEKVAESQRILVETENDMMEKINEYLSGCDMSERSGQVEKDIFALMMPKKQSAQASTDFGMDKHVDEMLADYLKAKIEPNESEMNVDIDDKYLNKQDCTPTPANSEETVAHLSEITPSPAAETTTEAIETEIECEENDVVPVPVCAVKLIHSNTNLSMKTSTANISAIPPALRPSKIPIRSRQSTYSSQTVSPSTSTNMLYNPMNSSASTNTGGPPSSSDDRPIISQFNHPSRLAYRPRARTSQIPVRRPQTTSSTTATNAGPSFIPFTPPPSAIPKRPQSQQQQYPVQSAASRRSSYSRNLNNNNTLQPLKAKDSASYTAYAYANQATPVPVPVPATASYSSSNTRQIKTNPSSTSAATAAHFSSSNTRQQQQLKVIPSSTIAANMVNNLHSPARSLPYGHNRNNNNNNNTAADFSSSKENSSLPLRASTRVHQKRAASKDKPYAQIMAEKHQYALMQEQILLEKRQRRENNPPGSGSNTPKRSQSPRF